jgi:enoyl-CoA hydratase
MSDLVLLEREGEIARITLNQPAKLNAVNNRMWTRLGEILTELDADHGVRCIILGGSGDKAFSVGADISEFEQNRSSVDQARRYHEHTHRSLQALSCCRHPVIAQIKGLCVGGGLELATVCDLRICGASARFGIPVKRLGLVVSYTELKPLIDLIGPANALEILLEGRIRDAEDALRMGLVNKVVADAEVEHEALATAMRIVEGAPLVARWHKKFVRRLLQPEPLTEDEMGESFECFDTEDFRAGYQAFLAKSKPEFKGR